MNQPEPNPPAVVAGTGEPPRQEARTLSASGEPLKWCSHVGGLGPPFPFCAICEAETATPEPPQARQPPLSETEAKLLEDWREQDEALSKLWGELGIDQHAGPRDPVEIVDLAIARFAEDRSALLALREGLEQTIQKWSKRRDSLLSHAHYRDEPYDDIGHGLRIEALALKMCADELQSLLATTVNPTGDQP